MKLLLFHSKKTDHDELQDLGSWEAVLSVEAQEVIKKFSLSKKTVWNFGDIVLGQDEVKAIIESIQLGPKEKKITSITINYSSRDVRLGLSKELAIALAKKITLKHLTLSKPRRQSAFALLLALVECDNSSVETLVLQDLDLPEDWSPAQFSKVLSKCKWKEVTIQNGLRSFDFKREEVNSFYSSISSGLDSNTSIKRFSLRNLPGANNGDIGKLFDGLKRNDTLASLNISLEDVWDRLKVKILADFLNSNYTLEELFICGADRTVFDVVEFTSALENTSLKRLVVSTIETEQDERYSVRGLVIDDFLKSRLQKLVDTNKNGLTIEGVKEGPIPKVIILRKQLL